MNGSENEIAVVYDNEDYLVVDKPAGLLSVPGRGPEKWDCVVHRVQKRYPTARIVHRLDCATSGLMLLALNANAHRELSRQFHDRIVQKSYEALVDGQMNMPDGKVEQPLITDWPNRPRQKIDHEQGKYALTHYTLIRHEQLNRHIVSRIQLKPVTGRSHQLRVHMQYLGHPIIGDRLYASREAIQISKRLCLHAKTLSFLCPQSAEPVSFELSTPF